MIPPHLKKAVVTEGELLIDTIWKVENFPGHLLGVVDAAGYFSGVISRGDLAHYFGTVSYNDYQRDIKNIKVGEVYNKQCLLIEDNQYLFPVGRDIFNSHPTIRSLPVIDKEKRLTDILFRFQAFYNDYFKRYKTIGLHPGRLNEEFETYYLKYAYCLWLAAREAKSLGYDRISVIEFGVFNGNGLIALEWHSRAIERLFNVAIDLYGFDNKAGLPELADHRDLGYLWSKGSYKMSDSDTLTAKLFKSQIVWGDIRDTAGSFFDQFHPAPIGAMLLDVDLYSSTLPILDMLKASDRFFLPRVWMYFDDIFWNTSYSGEALAIKEFNAANQSMKISPEDFYSSSYSMSGGGSTPFNPHVNGLLINNVKTCHRFQHDKYNIFSGI